MLSHLSLLRREKSLPFCCAVKMLKSCHLDVSLEYLLIVEGATEKVSQFVMSLKLI
jgi:hypothetical protein